jgi:hypothetical protein
MIEQVPTQAVSLRWMVSRPTFELGFADGRGGRGFHHDFERWAADQQWNYECGRLLAVVAPKNLSLNLNGEINPKIVRWWRRANTIISTDKSMS